MSVPKERKSNLLQSYQIHKKDSGSSGVQIALLTERINTLSGHLKNHKWDRHSRMGLLRMVERRKRLLSYLAGTNPAQYTSLVEKLNLRK